MKNSKEEISEVRENKINDLKELRETRISFSIILKLAILGFLSGAILGQIIDIAYPMNNALHYHYPIWEIESLGIEICWWIPILYGTAGMILAVSHPLLDRWTNQKPRGGFNPSWLFTTLCIGVFVVQWFMAPYLSSIGVSNALLFPITIIGGLLVWYFFDRTDGGLFMCILTAICGPLVEITLINVFSLYNYTNPDVFAIPLWILGAYICGAPGNANLGRKYFAYLQKE
ncbi:MAG: hypothetical protein GF329_15575 [Candidatus Lokiarchaeota archaeon]|nr:hypothetical protein [Candidatus Lokiarchaeota archaeon]